MKDVFVVKLGGSVITKKSKGRAEINKENLVRLGREISEAKKEKDFSLVVVHGAGPFGHVPAEKYKLYKGLKTEKQIEGMTKTHQSMEKLNFQVIKILQKEGLPALSFQPSSIGILENKKLIYFPLNVLEEFLKLDLIPVLYGDVLIDKKTGINILSGDHLVPYLGKKLKARKVILCADVDGIFNEDPKKNKKAKLVPILSPDNFHQIKLKGSESTDVTGGMERKVNELLELVEEDIEVEIINGFRPSLLKRSLLGETGLGTTIKK